MFTEPKQEKGWIEVICGSMYSGKTEELIRRLNRSSIANQRTILFKPSIDIRYDEENVVSHNKNSLVSIPIDHSRDIWNHLKNHEVVGIDEAQFMDDELPKVCGQLANKGIRVILAGLDMDYTGKPFGAMPQLMAEAEYVTKVHAICMSCGDLAGYTFKKVLNNQTVELGEKELYEARCRGCFNEGMALLRDQLKMDLKTNQ